MNQKFLVLVVVSVFLFSITVLSNEVFAPPLSAITLGGNVIVTDNLDVGGSISSQTITDLNSRLSILEGGS